MRQPADIPLAGKLAKMLATGDYEAVLENKEAALAVRCFATRYSTHILIPDPPTHTHSLTHTHTHTHTLHELDT